MPGPSPPVIDIEVFRSGGIDIDRRVMELDRACRDSGLFAVTGHGIDNHLIDLVFEQARRFFALPDADKAAIAVAGSTNGTGYVSARPSVRTVDEPGVDEALTVLLEPAARRPPGAAEPPISQMPDIGHFALTIIAYQRAVLDAAAIVLRGLALALELRAGFFERRMRNPACRLDLVHRQPDPTGGERADRPGRLDSDRGLITVACFDGAAPLDVGSRDGAESRVEVPDGALVVSLGDLSARWTNDRYVSTRCRPVDSPATRYSAAFFVHPDDEAVVEPMPSCVGAANPARYPAARAVDLLGGRLDTESSYGTARA